MEDRLQNIENSLAALTRKINDLDQWIDRLNDDFLFDFTDPDQDFNPSWYSVASSIERMELVLLAMNEKFNLKTDEIDVDLNKKILQQEIEIKKLEKRFERVEEEQPKYTDKTKNVEWEKIAQTLSHTMKSPNNNIVRKIDDLIDKPKDLQSINNDLVYIQAEAKYCNDIIKVFDIIRQGDKFNPEYISAKKILSFITDSEKRCISLAKHDASELSKSILKRIKGQNLSDQEMENITGLINYKNIQNINLEKEYKVDATALRIIIDELVLNMFRHAKSQKKDSNPLEKPEIFEIVFEQKDKTLSVTFRNTSRDAIYGHWDIIVNKKQTDSLTRKSFGLYLVSLFNTNTSLRPSIAFYQLDIPNKDTMSEITLTFNEE
jgi:two-component sensor histidine kinase